MAARMMISGMFARRGLAAAQPALAARATFSTGRVLCEANNGNKGDKVPVTAPNTAERDLAAEQVNRIGEPAPVSIVSDAPNALHQRQVRIYRPAKPSTQSGRAGTRHWRVDFDLLQESGHWESPLMGWAATGDSQQALGLWFGTKEQAIHFCQKQGWDYLVQEHKPERIPPKSYADNFVYRPKKLRLIPTK